MAQRSNHRKSAPTAEPGRKRTAAAGKGERPSKGTSETISISLEKGLLAEADKLAATLGITRARLVATGLEILLTRQRHYESQSSPLATPTRRRSVLD